MHIAGLEERIGGLESLYCEAQVAATTEVERVRQQSQSELEALRTELRDKQQALQHQQAAVAEFEANLKGQIQDLANQLTEKQAWLERRDQEFEQLGSEAALLRERIAQLESAAHEAGRSSGAEAERIRGEFAGGIGRTPRAAQGERARLGRESSLHARIRKSLAVADPRSANPANRKAVAARSPECGNRRLARQIKRDFGSTCHA